MNSGTIDDAVWDGPRSRAVIVARPYAAWPPAGRIAAMVGLTVLAAAGMAMWGPLADLRLVEHGDELVVKDLLTGNLTIRPVAN
jgi:hypothetical protein